MKRVDLWDVSCVMQFVNIGMSGMKRITPMKAWSKTGFARFSE